MNTITDAIQQLQSTRKILMDALVHVDVLLAVLAPDTVTKVPVAGVSEPPTDQQPPVQPIRSGDFSA